MNKQLTPFEQAELNRQQNMKRLVGILVATALTQRIRLLQLNHIKMTKEEQVEWETMISQVIRNQIQHFGFDA